MLSNEVQLLPNFIPDWSGRQIIHLSLLHYSAETRLIPYRINNKWGFSNTGGTISIPCIYKRVDPFIGGYAVVELFNGQQLLINKANERTIGPINGKIQHIGEGFVKVYFKELSEYRLFKCDGHEIEVTFNSVGFFNEGYVSVRLKSNGKQNYALIDKDANVNLLGNNYEKIHFFNEGLCMVSDHNSKCGYIDRNLQEVINCQFDNSSMIPINSTFFEGHACVYQQGKLLGLINKTGNLVLPLTYDYADGLSAGLSSVELNGKWGYVDLIGDEIIPLKFDFCTPFRKSYAVVRRNFKKYKYGIIDKKGDLVMDFKYDDITLFQINEQVYANVRLGNNTYRIDMNESIVTEKDLAAYNGGIYKTDLGYAHINGLNYWED